MYHPTGKKPRLSSYQNYALAQPDTDGPLPVEGEDSDEEEDEDEEDEEEELPQGDAPYDLAMADGYVPDNTMYRDYGTPMARHHLIPAQDKYFDVQPLDNYLKTCTDCYGKSSLCWSFIVLSCRVLSCLVTCLVLKGK